MSVVPDTCLKSEGMSATHLLSNLIFSVYVVHSLG